MANLEAKLIQIATELSPGSENYIGDDAAVVRLGDKNMLFCLDNFIEGTHFTEDEYRPEDIGWKSIAVNLSDIAAMAGKPLFALIGLSLSDKIEDKEDWVRRFYTGLNECAQGVKVIGGDITSSKNETAISITLIGEAERPCLRSTGKPGMKVCVTGEFGLRSHKSQNPAKLRPTPRIQEAQDLIRVNTEAALIDSSDGLVRSLYELAEASKVDLQIDTNLIPRPENVDLSTALYTGEDYELVALCEQVPDNWMLIGLAKTPKESPNIVDIQSGEILTKNEIYSHF